jgi:hypothetical protein
VHPGALGDVVLFGHLLNALRRACCSSSPSQTSASSAPLRSIILLAGGEKARLLTGLGVVDQAMDFESLPMHEVFADTPPAVCRLPGLLGRYDRLMSCFPTGDGRAEARLAEMCGATAATFLPVRPPADCPGHLTDLWADMLGLAAASGPKHGPHSRSGVPPLSTDLATPTPWVVPDAWRRQAAALLAERGIDPARPFVAIHPGAGDQAKCWPLERFVAVASALRAAGTPAVFVLGPVELERWGPAVAGPLGKQFPVVSGPDLPALTGLLSAATCYLGNDSGASHLAAAVGTPTVALFGPTDPRHFRPLGRCVRVVAEATMDDIDVVDVVDAVNTTPA